MLPGFRKLLFTVEAVVDIALNCKKCPVRSADITAHQGIPKRYLEHIMQELVHQKILEGVRGPRGGYRLAREAKDITLADILEVVSKLDEKDNHSECSGSPLSVQVIQPIWTDIRDSWIQRLGKTTIADLCDQAKEKGLVEIDDVVDFQI